MINTNNFFKDCNDELLSNSPAISTAIDTASYIIELYREKFQNKIDELKLHKLLYFVQRECLADTGTVAFNDEFRAWKYGPVLLAVREAYKNNSFPKNYNIPDKLKEVINIVFAEYAQRSSWSLIDATHRELSWRNARKGIPDGEKGNNIMELEDIKKDAERLQYARARDAIRRIIDESE